jgi:alpha-tubulin suppressor-like RCC1 family protein/Ca2+-binding RTX toxin-like protein
LKVIVTLANQWEDCEPASGYKDETWYAGGYQQPDPSGTVSYRDWVAEIVDRYKADPTILAWQLMNSCSGNAEQLLHDFGEDVSGLVKSIDPDHLVSLGTMGSGQCGAQEDDYAFVHDVPTIDLCGFHDYDGSAAVPGDAFNGLPVRIQQCDQLDKPMIVDEMGLRPVDVGGIRPRASIFHAKLSSQLARGIDGIALWAFYEGGPPSPDSHDIRSGDPALRILDDALWESPGPVTALGRGLEHACAAMTAGGFMCWGDGRLGDLGDGSTFVQRNRPVNVVGIAAGAEAIDGGGGHTCGLVSGAVKCWGEAGSGQLGHGVSTTHSPVPVDPIGLSSGVGSITAYGSHTCVLSDVGGASCWGANSNGQLGRGNAGGGQDTPAGVDNLASGVTQISAGYSHTCALMQSGGAKCWGIPYAVGDNDPGQTSPRTRPVDVFGLTSGVASIGVGGTVSCAVMLGGSAKCWGVNDRGQLGNGGASSWPPAWAPEDVVGLTGAIAIATSGHHTCAILVEGSLRCWGANSYGQLGDGTTDDRFTPVAVVGLPAPVRSVSLGYNFTCALLTDGSVWCWGRGEPGMIGVGTTQNHWTPTEVQFVPPPPKTLTVTKSGQGTVTSEPAPPAIYCGTTCSADLDDAAVVTLSAEPATGWAFAGWSTPGGQCTGVGQCTLEMVGDRDVHAMFTQVASGQLFSWGTNLYGQLGIGADSSVTMSTIPVPVSGLSDVVAFADGTRHALAVRSDGAVWGWGTNGSGQVGDGSTITRTTPVRAGTLTGVVAVAAGTSHSLALDGAGRVWSWGSDAKGQLGNGAGGATSSPQQILVGPVGTVIEAISAGADFGLALDAAGDVWSWGDDGLGQLGNGGAGSSQTPARIDALSAIQAIDAGAGFGVALDAQGDVWAWGDDTWGQQGNGTSTGSVQTPVAIGSLPVIDALSAGAGHVLALDDVGKLWGWGLDNTGQVTGSPLNPSPPPVLAPVEVDVAPAGVVAISAGANVSGVRLTDGTVESVGGNVSGQLGDGSAMPRTGYVRMSVIHDVSALAAGSSYSLAVADTVVPIGEQASGSVAPGGAVTTNPSGGAATKEDPIDTTVTSPVAGAITIQEEPVAGTPPSGYGLAGQVVSISAPVATPANPLIISFLVDQSHVPPGQSAATLQIFRNGVMVPNCTGSGASPDPCVATRAVASTGDPFVTVRTSAASEWGTGFPVEPVLPGAPTSLSATPGNGQAVVTWSPPADNGSEPVQGYTVTLTAGGQDRTVSVDALTTSATVGGLTNGTTYDANVAAFNGQGTGPPGGPASVIPFAGVGFSVSDVSFAEGDSGSKNLKFVVSVPAHAMTVKVTVRTQDGSASAGSDYVAVAPKVVGFPVGTLSKNVVVAVNGDTASEPDEHFTLELSNPTGGASISDPTGLATIVDDDQGLEACTIVGTGGPDLLVGTTGDDVICGLAGNDTLNGMGGNDTLLGSTGNDTLSGGPGDDTIDGAAGNDKVRGGPGNDGMTGGDGTNDTLLYDDAGTAAVSVSLLLVGVEQNTSSVTGVDRIEDQGFENVTGGGGPDVLHGNAGNNTIKGGAGSDHLFGEAGIDTCIGGGGVDTATGCETTRTVPRPSARSGLHGAYDRRRWIT